MLRRATLCASRHPPQELAQWRKQRAEEHDKEIVLDVETAAKVGRGDLGGLCKKQGELPREARGATRPRELSNAASFVVA